MGKKKPQDISLEIGGTSMEEAAEITSGIPMYQQPPVTELTVPKTFKVGDMEVNKETLIAQRTKDVELVINGVDDTKGYKAANALRAQYRTLRTTLEKYRKDVSKPHQEFVKQLKTATDELGAEALIGEQYFDTLMTEIDNEKQRIKEEEAKLQQQRIQSRINQLFDYGARFDGETYSFSYDESLIITAVNVSAFPDGDFADFVADVQDSYDKEQERINDQLAADELKKEQDRIQAEKDKALIDAANEKVRKVREKELIRVLGYSFSEVDGEYSHPDIPITVKPETLSESDDESWEALIYAIEHYEAVVAPEPAPVVEEEQAKVETVTEPAVAENIINELKAEVQATDGIVPVSTQFYMSDVVDYSDKDIPDEETFKDWAAEELIEDVRENTPFAECGDSENTMLFKWDGKYLEVTITNISWNRHDKQYYFIDMWEEPKLVIRQVIPQQGKRPLLTCNLTMVFNQEHPFTDVDISPKMFQRFYPEEYADKATTGIEVIANSGKVQDLCWMILAKP